MIANLIAPKDKSLELLTGTIDIRTGSLDAIWSDTEGVFQLHETVSGVNEIIVPLNSLIVVNYSSVVGIDVVESTGLIALMQSHLYAGQVIQNDFNLIIDYNF